MQQSLTITIDKDEKVYYGGMRIGEGEEVFRHALDELPINEVEKITVRDERDPADAQQWEFYHPYEFNNLKDGVDFFPAENYAIENDWHESELRSEEEVYLDPDFMSKVTVEEEVSFDYMPKPRKPKPAAPEPEPEPEPEVEPEPEPEIEPEVEVEVEPEPEVVKEPLKPAIAPEEAELIEWTPDSDMERDLSEGYDDEEDLFSKYVDTAAVEALPKGITEHQVYLPGERLETTPIAEKKAAFKVNKKRSKTPLYVLAGILAFVGIFFFFKNGGFTPPTEYTATCVDARTLLVADAAGCKAEKPNYSTVYVLSSEAGLPLLSSLPESAVFERPTGNVRITEL